ncbi:Synaptotagmin-like protein 3 [Collichthys lucidus]|uniref:Synaptotagmin-like protein 3 n=1 Tax=Collichthys lucidus TaxID=240159 RepID=A0A4U5UPI4_COLLU|nr:Synaptotagmin-like protein 3 [Collichthys lucidus]
MDLSLLQALERERVLEVLQRDKQLRSIEEDRIRRMKYELQELRRRGAKSFSRQYGERTCARCQRPLGKFWNSGAVCHGCSHRICSRCRVGVGLADWKCTVCHAYREVKIKSGEWFLDQRARKFQVTSEISSSQNDVQEDLLRVENTRRKSCYTTQKSLSDTDINKAGYLFKVPSLPNLFKRSKDSDQEGSSTGPEEETSFGSEYSYGKRGSNSSISTECGLFESVAVAGELELALAYNTDTACLEIRVGACRNLNYGNEKKKKCHPYVKLQVLPEKSGKMKTAVKKNTTDPIFNEVLKYHVERHLLFGKRLQASVWHSRTLKRKTFLGEVLIPLDGWRFEDKASQYFNWYPLCPKVEGPSGGTVDQDGSDQMFKVNQGERLRLSSLKHLREKETRLSVRRII